MQASLLLTRQKKIACSVGIPSAEGVDLLIVLFGFEDSAQDFHQALQQLALQSQPIGFLVMRVDLVYFQFDAKITLFRKIFT